MNRLKELRQEKNLTLKELSQKVNIPASTLGSYEQTGNSSRKLTGKNVNVLANFFEVTPLYLTGASNIRDSSDFLKYANKLTEMMRKQGNTATVQAEYSNLLTYELNRDFTNLYNSVHKGVSIIEDDKPRLPDLNEIINSLDDYSKEQILFVIRQVFTNLVKDKLEMETDFDIDELIDLLDIDY